VSLRLPASLAAPPATPVHGRHGTGTPMAPQQAERGKAATERATGPSPRTRRTTLPDHRIHRNIGGYGEPPLQRLAQTVVAHAILDALSGALVRAAEESLQRMEERCREALQRAGAQATSRGRHRSQKCPILVCPRCEYDQRKKAVSHARTVASHRTETRASALAFFAATTPDGAYLLRFWADAAGWDHEWLQRGLRQAQARGIELGSQDLQRLIADLTQSNRIPPANGDGHQSDDGEEG